MPLILPQPTMPMLTGRRPLGREGVMRCQCSYAGNSKTVYHESSPGFPDGLMNTQLKQIVEARHVYGGSDAAYRFLADRFPIDRIAHLRAVRRDEGDGGNQREQRRVERQGDREAVVHGR